MYLHSDTVKNTQHGGSCDCKRTNKMLCENKKKTWTSPQVSLFLFFLCGCLLVRRLSCSSDQCHSPNLSSGFMSCIGLSLTLSCWQAGGTATHRGANAPQRWPRPGRVLPFCPRWGDYAGQPGTDNAPPSWEGEDQPAPYQCEGQSTDH